MWHQSAEAKRISMYKPRQYSPISAGVDFRILLRLIFKVRIKCEGLPEIAVLPLGAQAAGIGDPLETPRQSAPVARIALTRAIRKTMLLYA
ncbi:MAG: hypothetical protein DMG55_23540 [Acidobacteria bacterium]|nr:MAG: hypothetical protein DMG55_23540 [Acidobacteriota bacterium]